MPPDTIGMFEPLVLEQRPPAGGANPTKTPIIPVPPDAPSQNFRHLRFGYPTAQWEYRLAGGELAGYACRFDCFDAAGEPDKVVLPITYCDLGDGHRAWRSRGLPAPHPLFCLPDIVRRPEAPVLICEGEKAAAAGAAIFPDHVVPTPMHGAKSPHKTDWSSLGGRKVVIWPDNDRPGTDFAQTVAALATKARALSVAIVDVPADWPQKWDLADPIPNDASTEMLRELLASASAWRPATTINGQNARLDGPIETVTTPEERATQQRRVTEESEITEVEGLYPLPDLEEMRLKYLIRQNGGVGIYRFAGMGADGPIWDFKCTPIGVSAQLRKADAENSYGVRVMIQDMEGSPRALDFDRADLARMNAAEIRARLRVCGSREMVSRSPSRS